MTVILGFLISMIGTGVSVRLALSLKTLDCPNEIKIHTSPTPALGGLGILLGSLLSTLITMYLEEYSYYHMLPILMGALVMFVIGFADDIQALTPGWKLGGQIASAVTYAVSASSLPSMRIANVASWPTGMELFWVTVLVVGLSNSMNLFDGTDGVLAGTSAIMACAGSVIARINGNASWSVTLLAVTGSCIGFLVFNVPPAKTFMGDCGSLYLGYTFGIAVHQLALDAAMPTAHAFAWLTVLALPICDTAFAIVRRIGSPAGLLSGDRRHIYDMLNKHLAGNVLKTALIIWCGAATLGVLGVWITHIVDSIWPPVVTAATYLVLFSVGGRLGCLRPE